MQTYETERLLLRPFLENDFDAVHSYASCRENVVYMMWGPNEESDTRAFISRAIADAAQTPIRNYQFAVVLKSTGGLIGACKLDKYDDFEAEIGWILHRDYWKNGYGTEMGAFLIRFGFDTLGLHRIIAHCDSENYGSYRVMEHNGMRREGCFFENRREKFSGGSWRDEYSYAILAEEWQVHKEISYYNALPVVFDGFIDLPELSDGEIELVCINKQPAEPEKKYVPAYNFEIHKDGKPVGLIDLRIGYTDGLYYGGQIGYSVDKAFRGSGYAGKACRLLAPVIKAHKMEKVLITNNVTNEASRRVCEKLGFKLVRKVRLPEWCDLYKEGQRFENIFEWSL